MHFHFKNVINSKRVKQIANKLQEEVASLKVQWAVHFFQAATNV